MREEINEIVKSLIQKVRDNNQDAFSELLSVYSPLISSYTNKFKSMPNVTPQDIEDFKQELIMVLYNSSLSYDLNQNEVSFGLYSKICMNNAYVTQIRAFNKRKDNAVVLVEYNSDLDELVEDGNSPEHELMEREKLKEINRKIEEALSPFENKVWKMYFAGYSSKEIAKCFDKTDKSIDNAIFRIRRKLKPIFANTRL